MGQVAAWIMERLGLSIIHGGWESLPWKILHRKNGDLNFSESSEEEDQCVHRAVHIKPEIG